MFNWFDLMRQAQTNAGIDTLARQYHLSGDQMQRSLAALLPAFAMGLQQAADPNDPTRFLQTMATDAYRSFWQVAGQSFSSQAQREGRRLLDQLFGSDEVSRRVAHQAADYSGVSIEVMQQILPIMAGIFAGGLYQWTTQAKALQTLTPASGTASSKQSSGDPWTELWASWLAVGMPEKEKSRHPFEELMAGFLQPPGLQKSDPHQIAPGSPSWESMMETGREMQRQYLASLQTIFEEAWRRNDTKR